MSRPRAHVATHSPLLSLAIALLATAATPALGGALLGDAAAAPPATEARLGRPDLCAKTGTYRAVWELQWDGEASPYEDTVQYNVRGVVTSTSQLDGGGPRELWGFFMQAHEPDCDPETSDGIFVYTALRPKRLAPGTLVQIDGARVVELRGPDSFIWEKTMTALDCSAASCTVAPASSRSHADVLRSREQVAYEVVDDQLQGAALAAFGPWPAIRPVEYRPPANETEAAIYHERHEGMLVRVSEDATVVAAVDEYNVFGLRRGVGADRFHREGAPTGELVLVDASGVASASCGVRGAGDLRTFDTVRHAPEDGFGIIGPLNYGFNTYKIHQDDDLLCIRADVAERAPHDPHLAPAPAQDDWTVTIATLNVHNLFDPFDDPLKSDELSPPIPSAAEFKDKLRKLAETVCNPFGLNAPTVIGLQEVENRYALEALADRVATACDVEYDAFVYGSPDFRGIDVAFLVRRDRVVVHEATPRQGCSEKDWGVSYQIGDGPAGVTCFAFQPYYLHGRPPVELVADVLVGGAPMRFHFFVVHFKSKLTSTACAQADCTDWRVAEAQWVDGTLGLRLRQDPSLPVVVLGDFNDYYDSEPLRILTEPQDGSDRVFLRNTWADLPGPDEANGTQGSIERYNYVYNGVAQVLDHVLVSEALEDVPRTVSPRHINTDYAGYFEAWPSMMYRVSDHDPIVVAFHFGPAGDGSRAR